MDKIKALIVDDDSANLELVEIMIKKYCHEIGSVVKAQCIETATELYFQFKPEILFLDIQLSNDATIFEFTEHLVLDNVAIIYITSHEAFAINAINNSPAYGYLLKPVKFIDFKIAYDKALRFLQKTNEFKIAQDSPELLAIPSMNKIDIVAVSDILYLKAEGRYSTFYMISGDKYTASRNLGEYEKLLNTKSYFRIHHKYIVNLKMVGRVTKEAGLSCMLKTGESLPVAKRRQEGLLKLLCMR